MNKPQPLRRHSRESGKCEAFIETFKNNFDRDNLILEKLCVKINPEYKNFIPGL